MAETPEQIADREKQETLERQRAAAEKQGQDASKDDGIFGLIKQFLQFLFGSFLGGNDKDAPQEEESVATPDTPQERIAQGAQVLNSKAIPKWAEFQKAHRGEAVVFKSPVNGQAQVTSGFGHRDAPTDGKGKIIGSDNHPGIDIGARGADASPDILAAADGIVLFTGKRSGYGNAVILGHADGTTTLYGHMSGSHMPAIGQQVAQGNQIGEMGSTGHSNGTHVHFEVRKGNTLVAPRIEGVTETKFAMLVGHETLPKFPVSNDINTGAPLVASSKPKTTAQVS